MKKVDLCKAELMGSVFYHTDLTEAKFIRAFMMDAKFTNAIMKKADLREADMKGTSFFGADLTEANLDKAKIKNTDFKNAKLHKVIGY
jgi:uncharacterized protein YjbI with pentapeptide repeats